MPTFGRFEELSGRAFAVEYRNDDPNSRPRETQIDPDDCLGTRPTGSLAQAPLRSASQTCWRRSGLGDTGRVRHLRLVGSLAELPTGTETVHKAGC